MTKTAELLPATEAITTVALYKPAEYGKNTHSFLNETSTGRIAKRGNYLQYNFGPVIKVEDPGTSLMILKIPREEDLTPVDALARNETQKQGGVFREDEAVQTQTSTAYINVLPQESDEFFSSKHAEFLSDIDKLDPELLESFPSRPCGAKSMCLIVVLVFFLAFYFCWLALL